MVTGAETPQSPGEYSEFTEFTARDEEDLLQQLYENTVDQACRFPTGCGAGTLGDQPLDLLINCRDPLSFLQFFPGYAAGGTAGSNQGRSSHDPSLPPGAFTLSASCEYCGKDNLRDCDPTTCARPKLYFQKKRPPFCKKDGKLWNNRDEAIQEKEISTSPRSSPPPTSATNSWVSFFSTAGRENASTSALSF